jgi:uncharacterized membrane-anchored protein YhcB (DUF1043 family)
MNQTSKKRTFLWAALVALIALVAGFLVGFVPQWNTIRVQNRELTSIKSQLRLAELKAELGSAAAHCRHGDYEPARKSVSEFFTGLRNEIDHDSASALSPEQREKTSAFLNQRDELITLLARNDPAACDRLATLYFNYEKATR